MRYMLLCALSLILLNGCQRHPPVKAADLQDEDAMWRELLASIDGEHAVISITTICGPHCEESSMALFDSSKGKWRLVSRKVVSVT